MLINTIYGAMDETQLIKVEGTIDNENELTTWVEYYISGSDEVVHRSAHVTLKQFPDFATTTVEGF